MREDVEEKDLPNQGTRTMGRIFTMILWKENILQKKIDQDQFVAQGRSKIYEVSRYARSLKFTKESTSRVTKIQIKQYECDHIQININQDPR